MGNVRTPCTVLSRAYRGQTYHVVVREDGFEFDDLIYPSLSAVAKVITGSHWNGLLFFKLTRSGRERSAGPAAKRGRRGQPSEGPPRTHSTVR